VTGDSGSAEIRRIRALIAKGEERTKAAEKAIAESKMAQADVLKLMAETAKAIEPPESEGDSDIALLAL